MARQIRIAQLEIKKTRSKEKVEQARNVLRETNAIIESDPWDYQETDSKYNMHRITSTNHLSIGDEVRVIDTNIRGIVSSIFEKTSKIELHSGKTRLRVGISDLAKTEAITDSPVTRLYSFKTDTTQKHRSLELDLRGKRAEEVEPELDAYLNDASIAGFHEVRIVHGYGAGVVRQIVRDMLSSHPLVRSFRSGNQGEGGDGVTVTKL